MDAVEESIRDVMECLLATCPPESGDAPSSTKKSNPAPRGNPGVINIEPHESADTYPVLYADIVCDSEVDTTLENDLAVLLAENQCKKNLDTKFQYFNKILEEFSRSNCYIRKVRWMRLYFIALLVLSKWFVQASLTGI